MRKAIETRLTGLTETAEKIDMGLWQGRFRDPDTAYRVLQTVVGQMERCRRILAARYGVAA